MYKIADKFKDVDNFIFMSCDSGDFCYMEHGDLDGAWRWEKVHGGWVDDFEPGDVDSREGYSIRVNTPREAFDLIMCEKTPDEVLEDAEDNYGYPMELGYVIEVEEE